MMKFKKNQKFQKTEFGNIPSHWELDKLKNHLVIKGRIGWKGLKTAEYTNDGPHIVTGIQIKEKKVVWEECSHITEKRYLESPEIILQKEDILMTKDGTIGKLAYIDKIPDKATVASHIHVIRKKSKKILPMFLLYFFESPRFQNLLQSKITGSVVPALTQKDINDTYFAIPPLNEQESISQNLFSLDQKIENLQNQNKILEKILETIFKSWFVNFNGQTEFMDSKLGKIPKGWNIKQLDQIANFLNGLALQKFRPIDDSFLPVIKIKEMKNGFTKNTEKASTNIKKEYIIKNGDILFSWSATLKIVVWGFGEGALNQHIFKITSDEYEKWFYYLWTKHHLNHFCRIAKDKTTTMGHIKREHLSDALVLVPTKEIMKELDIELGLFFNKLIENTISIKNLKQIKDTILPKLMSGELVN
jgi:type I restriction enzyme, S subunit